MKGWPLMDLNISIRNINVNAISTLGSLNVGKAVFLKNRSSSVQLPKGFFEEEEFEEEEMEEAEAEMEKAKEEVEKIPTSPVFYSD
ncbi:hypothetical protein [Virgibacillus kimchii]